MNNFMPVNLTTQMKWGDSWKDRNCPHLLKNKIDNLSRPICIKVIQNLVNDFPTN